MQSKLFDTHTHFNFNAYKDDWQEVIERTLAKNVWFANVGAEAKTSRRAVEIAEKYPEGVFATVGLHPIHTYEDQHEKFVKGKKVKFITKAEEFDKDFYKKLAKKSEKVVAIGETGLDYFHIRKFSPALRKRLRQKQTAVFQAQTELAEELKKPIIVHCRPDKNFDAYKEILEILKDYRKILLDPPVKPEDDKMGGDDKKIPGIIHCFQANIEILEKFLEYGFMIGYNGVITFTDEYDKLVLATPLENIVLETDAPWLTPLPYRGKRNESIYVKYVAKRIAELKNISFDEVTKLTTANAKKIFGLV